jgi:hypothetical protein
LEIEKRVFSNSKSALEWVSRAGMAMLVGDVDDAIYCFKKAKEVQPQFEIPSAVK